MNSKQASPNLKIDWCSYKAARFACLNWHYSGSMPAGKLVKVGVWEDDAFIGCVIFARGANKNMLMKYNLDQTEGCELARVALTNHKTPVTKIISVAISMLKDFCPGMKLIVSYADCDQEHLGIIYQAGNWIYDGMSAPMKVFIVNGKKMHKKSIHSLGVKENLKDIRKHLDPNAEAVMNTGKHRYLYPLDRKTRKSVLPLSQPYPKRSGKNL